MKKSRFTESQIVGIFNKVVAKHGRWGFWKCHGRLRLDGHPWNHNRIWRVYCQMRLNFPRRTRRRLMRPMQPLDVPLAPNEIWSLDFMSDSLYQGRRFRTLNVLDEGVREGLAIEVDTSLPAQRVVRVLQQLEAWRGLPKAIRLDNGPELTSQYLANCCKDKGIELRFIQLGKPNQNGFIERFNRSYRTEVLNSWLFTSLDEVREITHQWLQSYNEERPHDPLGNLPPAVFREQLLTGKNSTSELSP